MYPDQIVPISKVNNYAIIFSNVESSVNSTHSNFVLSFRKTYFDPMSINFPENSVESGIENLFSLESVVCSDKNLDNDYNNLKISEFKEGIKFKDDKYYVNLV